MPIFLFLGEQVFSNFKDFYSIFISFCNKEMLSKYFNFEVKRLVFIRLRLFPPSLTALKTRNCSQKIHLLYFLMPIFLSIFVNANFNCTYPTLSNSSKKHRTVLNLSIIDLFLMPI